MIRTSWMSGVAALAVGAVGAAQTTWYVDASGTPPGSGTALDPYTSIQHAIDQPSTAGGDTLAIRPGTYVENVTISKSLTLVGSSGPALTWVLPAGAGPVVRSAGGSISISGLTIAGGMDPLGDGIEVVSGSPTSVTGCILRDHQRHGLFSDYDAFVDRCTIVRNGRRPLIVTSFPNGLSATHCIMVDNGLEPDFGPELGLVQWNLIDLGTKGDVFGDPSFWNAAGDDFYLRAGSAAIDAGNPAQNDPDGSPPDLGALVFDPLHPPVPLAYCTAKVNSQGCTPRIGATGAPSASGAPFAITCADVLNQKSGLLFYGYEAKAAPYQGGWLCVRAPVKRTKLQSSGGNPPPDDCTGLYSYDFDARIQSGVDPGLVAGASVYAQYWYRDPNHASGVLTGRSDALYFQVAP